MTGAANDGWFTSSRSAAASDNCVEVRFGSDEVGVRDTKERSGPVFAFSAGAWGAFVAGAKAGRFDFSAPTRAGAC
ncbi:MULTISPECIES: DUF397 domain-containing protein [unclassified Saccharopolyspora]|uniref:DUF397 domain-containing protein n=1 Tax=unclassified Saccharopolyspora TaxID=2646250 RepID=UPI001CD5930D|nr:MULTISPECIES: DUF397 domain-containing protein [unclassified Saccharopolyspora]MCA1188227.1 DUF397 domain-containing protein [Saccharopolyspora sp. 6T]MCA1192707.1 DUF397 domain-containing protein [Saccharopolyspora sp. 6V]MCA1227941.1 DUF397 domain-containing protein [Saccharopolyspora sp. 6M]MCA1280462.1 DUF397 domain-containing protein [Saccharopolyspora sp. 7B]